MIDSVHQMARIACRLVFDEQSKNPGHSSGLQGPIGFELVRYWLYAVLYAFSDKMK